MAQPPRPDAFTSFGALLRYLRQRARLTQIDLAIATGYSTGQISRLEQNQRRPNPSAVHALFLPVLKVDDVPALGERLLELARVPDVLSAPAGEADAPAAPPRINPAAPLLVTKLFVPRPRPRRVTRPHLLAQLGGALQAPLTVVVAPAGWGKTTLLADWLQPWTAGPTPDAAAAASGPRVAWLALDAGDNDPTTFVRYLVAALQTVAPDVGKTTLAALGGAQAPAPELALRLLINDLAALTRPLVLVLDDYHLLTTPAIHAALAMFLEHMPPQLHVVLATRSDPPLPLARLRAHGDMLELRASELRFSTAEAAAFLQDVMDLALPADAIAALAERTEGWVAGLQLAGLALRERDDVAAFVAEFAGSNRYVEDYLAAEVVDRQPAHLRRFLLHTALLERMSGPLCDAVLGLGSAGGGDAYTQALLEELERANLFVVALDDTRRWYRYHHLFGAALRKRLLAGAAPDEVQALHARAAAWYQAAGLDEEAVRHAIAGEDWERAAELLEASALVRIVSGQVYTVMGWLAALPEAVLRRHPTLRHGYAVALMATNQFDAAEATLQVIERTLDAELSPDLRLLVLARLFGLRAHIRLFKGDFAASVELITQTLALLPDVGVATATRNLLTLTRVASEVYGSAAAYKATGDVSPAMERRVGAGIAPAQAAGNAAAVTNGWAYLGYLRMLQGRLAAALATYAEIPRQAGGPELLPELIGSPAYFVGLGELLLQTNQLADAEAAIERAMRLLEAPRATDADMIVLGYTAHARLQQLRGAAHDARATMGALRRVAVERQFCRDMVERAAALEARLWLSQGALPEAIAWAEASGLQPGDTVPFPREAAYLVLARVRIAEGSAHAILPLLERLLRAAERDGRRHSAIEIRVVTALACAALAEPSQALAALRQACADAAPEPYIRVFADEGRPMRELLQTARGERSFEPYWPALDRILAALGLSAGAAFGGAQLTLGEAPGERCA